MDVSLHTVIMAVLQIILINAVLSGDNAAVIGMAICHLPKEVRVKAAAWGTFFAIILRVTFTAIIALLLNVPYLRLIGGIILLLITYKLIKNSDETAKIIPEKQGFWQAIWIIVVADLSMSFDNVLAIAGAAQGNFYLIIIGLLVSMPILIFFSAWLSEVMAKHPLILWLGAAVLIKTGLEMFFEDSHIALTKHIGISSQTVAIGIAVVFFAYNAWRITSGYKKLAYQAETNVEKEDDSIKETP